MRPLDPRDGFVNEPGGLLPAGSPECARSFSCGRVRMVPIHHGRRNLCRLGCRVPISSALASQSKVPLGVMGPNIHSDRRTRSVHPRGRPHALRIHHRPQGVTTYPCTSRPTSRTGRRWAMPCRYSPHGPKSDTAGPRRSRWRPEVATSAASGNVCALDQLTQGLVVSVPVSPDDVAADHGVLLLV